MKKNHYYKPTLKPLKTFTAGLFLRSHSHSQMSSNGLQWRSWFTEVEPWAGPLHQVGSGLAVDGVGFVDGLLAWDCKRNPLERPLGLEYFWDIIWRILEITCCQGWGPWRRSIFIVFVPNDWIFMMLSMLSHCWSRSGSLFFVVLSAGSLEVSFFTSTHGRFANQGTDWLRAAFARGAWAAAEDVVWRFTYSGVNFHIFLDVKRSPTVQCSEFSCGLDGKSGGPTWITFFLLTVSSWWHCWAVSWAFEEGSESQLRLGDFLAPSLSRVTQEHAPLGSNLSKLSKLGGDRGLDVMLEVVEIKTTASCLSKMDPKTWLQNTSSVWSLNFQTFTKVQPTLLRPVNTKW